MSIQNGIKRIFVVVLDGVGAGELPDAALYGDSGSNTLAHTAEAVGGIRLPAMGALGLGNILTIQGVPPAVSPRGAYGKMREASAGKDTITGHWEIAGVVLARPFPTYPHGFPPEVIAEFECRIGRGTLGNYAASGTVIIEQLGAEHVRTGFPIVYTSADSVFQIAMHEAVIPIDQQYGICEIARAMLTGEHEVGRVIAGRLSASRAASNARSGGRTSRLAAANCPGFAYGGWPCGTCDRQDLRDIQRPRNRCLGPYHQ